MENEPVETVDEVLREAFATNGLAAARVTRRALVPQPARERPLVRGILLALAAVNLCAIAAVWLLRPSLAPAPGAQPPASVLHPVELSGSLMDGVLVVPIPDGSTVIWGPGRRDDRPPDGYGIVLMEGEVR